MDGDRCRCGDSAKDVDVTLCSGTGHPEVWKHRVLGQHRWARSHRDVPLLMCCGCPACKDEQKFMTRPRHCPQPAEMLPAQPGQGWCPRAADGAGRGSALAPVLPCFTAEFQLEELVNSACTWCFQTAATAKTRAQCFALDKTRCRVSSGAA